MKPVSAKYEQFITKKELYQTNRTMRKWKKKAIRDRMATEFMKGDIPYVVPIDPDMFFN